MAKGKKFSGFQDSDEEISYLQNELFIAQSKIATLERDLLAQQRLIQILQTDRDRAIKAHDDLRQSLI